MSTPYEAEIRRLRNRIAELEEENEQLRRKLEERKLVERAKGVLMVRLRLNEATAYRTLQRYSMRTRTPLAVLARRVLEGGLTTDLLSGSGDGR